MLQVPQGLLREYSADSPLLSSLLGLAWAWAAFELISLLAYYSVMLKKLIIILVATLAAIFYALWRVSKVGKGDD